MISLEEKIANRKKNLGGGQPTLSLEEKIANRKNGGGGVSGQKPIFSGGTFSDALDLLSVPQYAITGALSKKKTVLEAIKERYSPREALGVEGPVKGFLVDVILDPLNFLAPLSASKKGAALIKAGDSAATLGGAAKAGEKYLLGLSAPFADSAIPLIKGQKIMEGFTRAGNYIKKLPGIGPALSTLNTIPASLANDVDSIEENAKIFKKVKGIFSGAKGVERNAFAELSRDVMAINQKITPLVKANTVTKKEIEDILEFIANPKSGIVLKKELRVIADDIRENVLSMNKNWERLGGPKLKGKTFKNVLTDEAKEFATKGKSGLARRAIGGSVGSEEFAGYTRMTSSDGTKSALVNSTGTTRAVMEDGTKLRKIVDNLYVTPDVYKMIDNVRSKARIAPGSTAKSVRDAVAKAVLDLPGDKVFTREAASAREVNQFLQKQGKKAIFSEDPIKILLEQGADLAKLEGRSALVTSLRELDIAKIVKGSSKVPDGYRKVKIKGAEDVALPEMVADHFEKTVKAFSSVSEVQGFLKTYDKIQNTWKGMATFINPAFHTRNAVSNFWQMFLSGMNNPIDFIRGNRVERAMARAFKEGSDDLFKYVPDEYKDYAKEFTNELGLRSTGAFSTDIDKTIIQKFADNPFVKGAGNVGEFLENGAKLSMYIYKRKKGFKPKAAAEEVRKYLFDYSDLTDVEREVFKRAFPFYTWTRNNLPLQVAMLIHRPTRINMIAKANESLQSMVGGEPMDEQYMPEWLREAYPIYIGDNKDGLQKFLKLEGFIPSVDLNKIGRPFELPLEQLSPLIKTPIELIANYDFFYEKQISEYSGQKVAEPIPFTNKSTPVNAYTSKLIDLIRPVSEAQKFSWNPDRTSTAPSFKSQLINYLFGKTYDLSPDKQKEYFKYEQGKLSSEVKKDMNKAKTDEEKERLKAILDAIMEGEGVKL